MKHLIKITAVVILVTTVALLTGGCGNKSQKEDKGSLSALKSRLKKTHLGIKYIDASVAPGTQAMVLGVAKARSGARLGFEFVFMQPGKEPTANALGEFSKQVLAASGLARDGEIKAFRYYRGFVGNVAYGQYAFARYEGSNNYDNDLPISRQLDKALIDSFPKNDPEAHPILARP